jgi:hypothetical protein
MTETLNDDVPEKSPGSKGRGASERAKELVRQPRTRLAAAVVLVFLAAAVAWIVVGRDSSSRTSVVANPVGPIGLSADGLRTLAARVGQPIYWAGPRRNFLYELTRTPTGNVLIRYLPPGAAVGTRRPELTIATYPYEHALQALKNIVGGQRRSLPGGGLALVDLKSPKSVHVAFPKVAYQVEVFDRSPARAQSVAFSGRVRPVS